MGTFTLACGHKVRAKPFDKYAWLRAIQAGCMRCYLEAKAEKKKDDNVS
jgi:hypothetical protein